eukprot:TRINITY_DN8557_c0_g1_i1.p1 TRINITY_DN8557_c0_g1~~TRINITY_DN8557_c0_g1_i1.p1  ORF type:complete len:801 (-),score=199.86 TRINITY_DN8557_c0_g1_i1:20-2395(-)
MSTKGSYFAGANSGELKEIKDALKSTKNEKQKAAVKKVIALMTIGRDVSALFSDVVKCMQTDDLELKKLIYLYLMNYATSAPEIALLAVSTFQKDAADSANPLLRALAIRTMGCIRVDQVVEYLGDPLRGCLEDSNPYVRKTAALCVAKLYDLAPDLVEQGGFIESLKDLLTDSNPMVVANAVAALAEIDEVSPDPIFEITKSNLGRLMTAMEACTEWGQVFIMNSLSKYNPRDAREAEKICEKISPRLAHANSAVVLGSIKVILHFIEHVEDKTNFVRKIRAPLISLLSKSPEVKYVALRNINLILQRYPDLLQNECEDFFCKHNDKLYVKLEKLEILIMLANEQNVERILIELREYATKHIDVIFVKKAIRSIGRVAIRLESAAEKCVHVLLELLQNGPIHVSQEPIVVIKDIFRKYPNRYESIIPSLCEHIDYIDDPESKSAIIWILGEYADRISDALDLLLRFKESFRDEVTPVQLQILTSFVKLFLRRPKSAKDHVMNLLEIASNEIADPDVRDRAFIYWRLLCAGPRDAKQVVLAEKPSISDSSVYLDDPVLVNLLGNLSTLASVYHKPPETFIQKMKEINRVRIENDERPETVDIEKVRVLDASTGNGLQIDAGYRKTDGEYFFEITVTNHSNRTLNGIAFKFDKNSYSLTPQIPTVPLTLTPGSSGDATVALKEDDNYSDSGDQITIAVKSALGLTVFATTMSLPEPPQETKKTPPPPINGGNIFDLLGGPTNPPPPANNPPPNTPSGNGLDIFGFSTPSNNTQNTPTTNTPTTGNSEPLFFL